MAKPALLCLVLAVAGQGLAASLENPAKEGEMVADEKPEIDPKSYTEGTEELESEETKTEFGLGPHTGENQKLVFDKIEVEAIKKLESDKRDPNHLKELSRKLESEESDTEVSKILESEETVPDSDTKTKTETNKIINKLESDETQAIKNLDSEETGTGPDDNSEAAEKMESEMTKTRVTKKQNFDNIVLETDPSTRAPKTNVSEEVSFVTEASTFL